MLEYGVGRRAAREALQNLERMGIIDINQGERARVAQPDFQLIIGQMGHTAKHALLNSPTTLEDLKEARLVFETVMVGRAAERATPADIDRLNDRLDAQRRSLITDREFLARDMEFHREIAIIAGNPVFSATSQVVFGWLESFYTEAVRAPGAEQLTLNEHQGIIQAIAENDPELAAKRMSDHLVRANTLYRVLIRK